MRWDYWTQRVKGSDEELNKVLNRLGEDGWRLDHIEKDSWMEGVTVYGYRLFFVRGEVDHPDREEIRKAQEENARLQAEAMKEVIDHMMGAQKRPEPEVRRSA